MTVPNSGTYDDKEDKMYNLRLYVIDDTTFSRKTIKDLKKAPGNDFKNKYDLSVINILENPVLAENDKILATPTVIKHLPGPVRRIVGDLSMKEKVLLGLGLVKKENK